MIKWPDGKRVAVGVAFDVDLELQWSEGNIRDPEHIVYQSKGRYGAKQGMPRILNMLDTFDVKATFFTPAYNAEVYPELIKEIHRRGHEIAFHGYHHYPLRGTSYDDENKMMETSERIFQELLGYQIVGHRPCGGDFHDFTVRLLLDRGYQYMSYRGDKDAPYLCELDGKTVPLVELASDLFYDDTVYDFYKDIPDLISCRKQFEIWRDEFEGVAAEGGKVMDFVLHPQTIGRACRVQMLGELISHMQARGAWIATNKEIAQWVLRENGFEVG